MPKPFGKSLKNVGKSFVKSDKKYLGPNGLWVWHVCALDLLATFSFSGSKFKVLSLCRFFGKFLLLFWRFLRHFLSIFDVFSLFHEVLGHFFQRLGLIFFFVFVTLPFLSLFSGIERATSASRTEPLYVAARSTTRPPGHPVFVTFLRPFINLFLSKCY